MSAPAPIRLPPLIFAKTDEQLQAEIDEVCEIFYRLQVPTGRFTVASVLNFGVTTRSFVKRIRSFVGNHDDNTMNLFLAEAVRANLMTSVHTMTVAHLWNTQNFFFKTQVGRAAMERIFLERRLEKRRVGNLTVKDVALTHVLQLQVSDMAKAVKQYRNEADPKGLANIRAGPAGFYPASMWSEPGVVAQRAWALFEEGCRRNGTPVPAKTNETVSTAKNAYGGVVIAELKAEFVRNEAVRDGLVAYLQQRIAFFVANADVRQANAFRRRLAVIRGVEYATVAVAPVQEGDGEPDPSGGQLPPTELAAAATGRSAGEAAAGDKRQAPPLPMIRNLRSRSIQIDPNASTSRPHKTTRGGRARQE